MIADGREIGAIDAFSRIIEDQTLTFSIVDGEIVDNETLSVWNVLGFSISGEFEGEQLTRVVAVNHFWFSWSVFRPDTSVYSP